MFNKIAYLKLQVVLGHNAIAGQPAIRSSGSATFSKTKAFRHCWVTVLRDTGFWKDRVYWLSNPTALTANISPSATGAVRFGPTRPEVVLLKKILIARRTKSFLGTCKRLQPEVPVCDKKD